MKLEGIKFEVVPRLASTNTSKNIYKFYNKWAPITN